MILEAGSWLKVSTFTINPDKRKGTKASKVFSHPSDFLTLVCTFPGLIGQLEPIVLTCSEFPLKQYKPFANL